jgi:diguanylate cyclase (GGDEF)-like protein
LVKKNPDILLIAACALTVLGFLLGAGPAPSSPDTLLDMGVLAFSATFLELLAVELPYRGCFTAAFTVYFASLLVLDLAPTIILAVWALLVRAFALIFSSQGQTWKRFRMDASTLLLGLLPAGIVYHLVADHFAFLQPRQLAGMLLAVAVWCFMDVILEQIQMLYVPDAGKVNWLVLRHRSRWTMLALMPIGVIVAILAQTSSMIFSIAVLLPQALLRFAFGGSSEAPIRAVAEPSADVENSQALLAVELDEYKVQNKFVMNDLQKRVDELAILSETGQLLGASLDLNKTLEIIIQMIRKLIVYQSCVIFLMDSRSSLTPVKAVSPYKELLEMSPLLQLEEAMVSLVVQSRKPLLQFSMSGDHSTRIFRDESSVMCVPMVVKNEIIGVIYVGTLRAGTYNSDHVHLLEMLASPAAIAIKSAQLFEEQEEKNRALERANAQRELQLRQQEDLKALSDELSEAVDLKGTMHACVQKLSDIFQCRSSIMFVRQRAGEGVWVVADCVSPYDAYLRSYSSTPGEGLLDYSASLRSPLLILDARNAESHRNEELSNDVLVNERSIMLAPLRSDSSGETSALLYLGDGEPEKFTLYDQNLFEMLSLQVAIALEKATLYEKMKEQAITDGVTGLYTHRYFQERLIEEVKWSERTHKPLCLIMVDTDHFKKFNDTLGHPQGDSLLREIASLLKDSCRDSDLVCRYGGDEFTMILKETDKDGARKIAERIREAFELRLGKHKVKVTSSIGLACYPTDAARKEDLVKAADAALYESKRRGRNQVQVAQTLQSRPA